MKIIAEVDKSRMIRLSPHRFGQVGNLIIIEESNGDRFDLHFSDGQLRVLAGLIDQRLSAKGKQSVA